MLRAFTKQRITNIIPLLRYESGVSSKESLEIARKYAPLEYAYVRDNMSKSECKCTDMIMCCQQDSAELLHEKRLRLAYGGSGVVCSALCFMIPAFDLGLMFQSFVGGSVMFGAMIHAGLVKYRDSPVFCVKRGKEIAIIVEGVINEKKTFNDNADKIFQLK